MSILTNLEPQSVFKHFEEICAIPHGSGDMDKISAYCTEFARKNNLKAVVDEAKNVIIYKDGTKGYENSAPLILQGHIDMVCQKTEDCAIDFEKDGISVLVDNDFIKADKTTLGADNGIAVAMIMAILENHDLEHPPIEAVFTTDEETGMTGANELDASLLKGKRMINIDSEEANTLTVSCAGGVDVKISVPVKRKKAEATPITIKIEGLKGGHSGIEIDKGRVNADILGGRILNYLKNRTELNLISVNGGTKRNAIPLSFAAEVAVNDADKFINVLNEYITIVENEIKDREENFSVTVEKGAKSNLAVLDDESTNKVIYMLNTTPNGVIEMSAKIENLVETSLNLGVLKTAENEIIMQYALRSNKKTALDFLTDKMVSFAKYNKCGAVVSGRYEPWEYKENSPLRKLYVEEYKNKFNEDVIVAAIHAGLECAVFSSKIDDIDCISIGPDMFDVHTVNERLSISSTKQIFELLLKVIARCK